jgi:hypothetical protein
MIFVLKVFHHYLLGNNFTFFVDHELCESSDIYQQLAPTYRNGNVPLQLVIIFEPFMKRGLDYMGPIKPPTHYIGN